MKKTWCLVALVVSIALPAGAQYATSRNAIRKIEDRYVRAALANNWSALVELFADDAVLLPADSPAVTGSVAIGKWFASSGVRATEFVTKSESIEVERTLATNRGTYTLTFVTKDSSTPVTQHGHYLWVLRKGDDGVWRITVDMFHSSEPAPLVTQ